MSIAPQSINEFLIKKVNDGSCHSVVEAEKELMSKLIERDIDRRIAEGERQIAHGDYEILNDAFIDQFIADASKRVLLRKA